MPTITIDADDYADLLQRVQRAEGLLAGVGAQLQRYGTELPKEDRVRPEGDLATMFATGVTKLGDRFTFSRNGKSHTATINNVGAMVVGGKAAGTPSNAIKVASGGQANGWKDWHRVSDGLQMQDLRNQARERAGQAPKVWGTLRQS